VTTLAAQQFARVIIAMQPYVDDIVFVGGWVHALYLGEANDGGALQTEDIDVTLPPVLLTGDRATLLELAGEAGFVRDPISDMDDVAAWMVYRSADGLTIPIDFLTEGDPRRPVEIVGQPGLLAQGYPGQQMLLDSFRWLEVGSTLHPMLEPPRRIRVPTLGAYVVQKAVSAAMRGNRDKAAKDLVYIFEIIRHPRLGADVSSEIRTLRERYSREYEQCALALRSAVATPPTMRDVAEQLIEAGRSYGTIEGVAAAVDGRFRRLLAETA
jgi:hypothetical protein